MEAKYCLIGEHVFTGTIAQVLSVTAGNTCITGSVCEFHQIKIGNDWQTWEQPRLPMNDPNLEDPRWKELSSDNL